MLKARSSQWLVVALMILLAMGIVACERPARSTSDVTPTADVGVIVPGEGDTAAPVDGGGVVTQPPVDTAPGDTPAPITPPQPAEGDTGAYPPPVDSSSGGTAGTDAGDTGGDAASVEIDAAETSGDTTEVVETETTTDTAPVTTTPSDSVTGTPPATEIIHVVQSGETLYRIGLQYGYSWTVLAQYNGLANPNRVIVGQEIKIPAAGSPTTPTPPTTEQLYTVRRGDTLARIAAAYGVSWVQIAEANGIVNPNLIYPGQVLKIPANTSGPAPQFSHVVRQGETLFLISLRYGVLWTQIAEANNITAPYVIFPGQTLTIPGGN